MAQTICLWFHTEKTSMAQTVYLCLHTEIDQHGSVVMTMATNLPINPANVSIWSHYVFLSTVKEKAHSHQAQST